MSRIRIAELKPEDLRWSYRTCDFPLQKVEEAEPVEGTVGQDRAMGALRTGLSVPGLGYNVFVCGLGGTGRTSSVREIVETIHPVSPAPADRCYVHNFSSPDKPMLICLKKGEAISLKHDMNQLIERLKRRVPQLLEADSFEQESTQLEAEMKERGQRILKDFEDKLKGTQFTVAQMKVGPMAVPDIFPAIEGKPVTMEDFEKAVEKGAVEVKDMEAFKKLHQELKKDLAQILKKTRKLEQEALQKMKALVMRFGDSLVEGFIDDLKEKYANKRLSSYFDSVRKSVVEHLSLFRGDKGEDSPAAVSAASEDSSTEDDDPFSIYRVNVILDNTDRPDTPIVVETEPTQRNLFGTIDVMADAPGHVSTDFRKITGGSLLEADGGFLILNALDLLSQPITVWQQLKRTLKNQQLRISTPDYGYPFGLQSLQPEPIDVNVKVILIGDALMYELLFSLDQDFRKIFKIKAEFDTEMTLSADNVKHFMAVLAKIRKKQKLMRFNKNALGTILEHAIRSASRRDKVSTRFGLVSDLMMEANYIAQSSGAKSVSEEHVERAIDGEIERNNLIESKIKERIQDGTIMIDIEGAKVGQVNGLSVLMTASYAFGQPTRITATTAAGEAGIVNIEREAHLSGSTHDKGVLILTGFLRQRYGQDKPLNLSASICFEQSYGGVDGDSASSTELYCIISSLADLPIKQSLAVTGSVNQKGEIQPIGGANYKIEGFFDVCKAKGLTGEQGVLIPSRNVDSLMLRKDVVQAVAEGRFHIYPIDTIDQGLEVLTGVPAGKRGKSGRFPKDTVNYLADKKLGQLASALKEFAGAGKEKT